MKRGVVMNFARGKGRGVLLCLAVALPAFWLGGKLPVVGGPVFAILLGMAAAGLLRDRDPYRPGVAYTSKKVLQYAVVLLGFGMNLEEILAKGRQSLPIIILTISASLLIAFALCRAMKIPAKISVLVGVGSSICGGSAIAATAPVIEAGDEEIAQAISVIFLFNIAAALLFPALGGLLGMGDEGFGLFAGTAINDTSSVTAAAAAWDGMHGGNTLDAAAVVKLTRTLAIIPVTLALALGRAARAKRQGAGRARVNLSGVFPFFVLFFLLAAMIATWVTLPAALLALFKSLSKFLIVMAMAAIGLNTDLVKLVKTGGKPILMGLCCWLGIAAASLAAQHLMGVW